MRHVFRSRLRIVFILVLLFALFLIVRLYFLQVIHGRDYALAAEHQYTNASDTLYDRGDIYFTRKDGTLISAATLATGFLVAIDPEILKNPEDTYQKINAILPLDHDAFMGHAAKTDDPYEVIADQVPEDAGEKISELDITGVILVRERWRSYPAGSEAAQTVGLVAYNDDSTLAGRYGLERYYDDVLQRPGGGLFGNFFAELFANIGNTIGDAREAKEGDVITSIEPVVEQKLDDELATVQRKYASQASGGIIMDPATGEIVALDVNPSFDPNDFANENADTFGNPLVERRYEFGSIVKSLTMTSGIDSGAVTPQTTYNDTGCITVNKSRICNYDLRARGVIPMQQILSQSLNVGASWVSTQVGHARMLAYFKALGMDTETGIDLPSEIPGTLGNLESPGLDVNYDTASFGQGIAQTPVEMIRALGALANHGSTVTPHLATAIRLDNGVTRALSWGEPTQVFKPSAADTVTSMLITVVDTALLNGKAKNPDYTVAAKTGTAQIAAPGGGYYPGNVFFHSFFGYFPATHPRFIILLYTIRPQGVEYASETLTTSFLDLTHFLTNYYAIPPDRATYENPS
ncbi:MAG TPA: penicillin-binding protein 2 [Candidatus Paceibacterota bacterium]|nr:penicillin-binding protein 2 [Candidatus Paceibacterota bacterium]